MAGRSALAGGGFTVIGAVQRSPTRRAAPEGGTNEVSRGEREVSSGLSPASADARAPLPQPGRGGGSDACSHSVLDNQVPKLGYIVGGIPSCEGRAREASQERGKERSRRRSRYACDRGWPILAWIQVR